MRHDYAAIPENDMGKCGTWEVQLLDGRNIGVDPGTLERLDQFLMGIPESAIEEAHKLCMSVTDTRDGWLGVPNLRWVDRFKTSLGELLTEYDLKLHVIPGQPKYSRRYIQEQGRRRHG